MFWLPTSIPFAFDVAMQHTLLYGRDLPSTLSDNLQKLIYLATEALSQCRINHVADVANATGLRPQGGLRK